jgi:dGTPase
MDGGVDLAGENERNRRWASTMAGHAGPGITFAHADSRFGSVADGACAGLARTEREAVESDTMAPGATRAGGAGRRTRPEEPDRWRTCFERDRDRILHSTAFRRLAGKTQVFVFPDDHQRTRLTHALEVAQVATGIAQACRLNVALTEAIALGHDCGHGPGGHASEDALSPYLDGGFDHAPWGADVSLASLNLCAETLDGIRNHSWSRPAPGTPEGEVVSWADRIAYVCHDFEDAVRSGIVTPAALPDLVRRQCGDRRGQQLGTFIDAVVSTVLATGHVGMADDRAEALAAFRASNYTHIYLRPRSVAQGRSVVAVLQALVDHFSDRPHLIPDGGEPAAELSGGEPDAVRAAVAYVAGMTDRFAFVQAVALLGWDPDKLPAGIGVTPRL